jgi:hypothetical protein
MNERFAHIMRREVAVLSAALFVIAAVGLLARLLHKTHAAQVRGGEQSMTETTDFYCNLKALSAKERVRHMQLTFEIERARVETIELANGFAFRFQDGAVSLTELAEWVSAERKCCPFFDFEIELQGHNGPLWLKLRGKDGVKAFMRSEFGIR